MRVTVCEMNDSEKDFSRDWDLLTVHVQKEKSDLVLLPEMPFYPWLFWKNRFESELWTRSMEAHRKWLERCKELIPACVLGSIPSKSGEVRLNRGFVWDSENGCQEVHDKFYLPDEDGYWESTWYSRGDGEFKPVQCGQASVGFLICSGIWFFERSRQYGNLGAHIVACPRATPKSTLDKWLVAGQAAAVVSGAYSLSSNRVASEWNPAELGGKGWIIDPDGRVLGVTSQAQPFLTCDIDLEYANKAKHTYPRYIPD
ncbi:MAG: carbon-nitrogen hydrolase family protein [Candidatus Aminicenantes bacterium]|nr:carbon-nitrogen hydrolase family protein [Candidatus Aminicenantes bacterium]